MLHLLRFVVLIGSVFITLPILKAQKVVCPIDTLEKDTIALSTYASASNLFKDDKVQIPQLSFELMRKILYIFSTESVYSFKKSTLTSILTVDTSGTVEYFKYWFLDNHLVITDEQHKRIKNKIEAFLRENAEMFPKAPKKWVMDMNMTTIPPLNKKRFFKDYVAPNPQPTAPETSKIGLIQRLGNEIATSWQSEGTRNPMELKFLGLIHTSFLKFQLYNPLYKELLRVAGNEHVDSIHYQIFMYMYKNLPIVRAKYGYYLDYPELVAFRKQTCDCIKESYDEFRKKDDEDEALYNTNDHCKKLILEKPTVMEQLEYGIKNIVEQARKNQEEESVAEKVAESSIDGCVPFNCDFVLHHWANHYVRMLRKSDTLSRIFWSYKRQNMANKIIMNLYQDLPALQPFYKNQALFEQNKSILNDINKRLGKNKNQHQFVLMKQVVQNNEYIEIINIMSKSLDNTYFQIRWIFSTEKDIETLIRVEIIEKEGIKDFYAPKSN